MDGVKTKGCCSWFPTWKLLSDRFDPASRVSAFRSRFHGRSRRHHDDADTFADALAELCWVGYPQSPAELRQELIAEQFV